MKNLIKYLAVTLFGFIFVLSSCTGKFEEMNTNPFGVSDEELMQDNNLIGMHFPTIQQSIYFNRGGNGWEYQVIQNLNADIWSGYMATPTDFEGGINNQTYSLVNGWNDYCWNYAYNQVMSNQQKVRDKCQEQGYEENAHFDAINTILRVLTMSRTADQYGPIIYSKYGQSLTGGEYDSAQDAYKLFFSELTEAVNILNNNLEKGAAFKKFDMAFGGNFANWIKAANTLRLRLAMRVVKYDPVWAKTEAEAAIQAPQGLLTGKTLSFSGFGWRHPLFTCSIEYNDIFVSANVQSILSGYGDPRLPKFGAPKAADVIGIRTGIPGLNEYADRYKEVISNINVSIEEPGMLISASEAYFLLAEAALRGWNAGGESKTFYENGVKASFEQWGAGAADDYLNSTKKPAGWNDPLGRNEISSAAVSTITPKWDDSATNEEKLERIITQKWIGGYPEGMNAWAEWRRTGYPKLFPILKNDSQGIIPTELGVRRLSYTVGEKANNPQGYAKAVELLGGPDNGASRLFWDKNQPNF
ncbi:hypothetical protein FACS189420_5790 [Bacteroidia bacterium]|nr:hypothetical protein FACS189420_5790 [Bacteroidia bacterium]